MLDSRCNKLEVRRKATDIRIYINRCTHAHACIYRSTHTNIYIYIHIYIHTYRQTDNRRTDKRMDACALVRTHQPYIYICIHILIHTCMYIQTDIRIGRLNIHTCMQASTQHRHTLIPIHTRTDARTQAHANRQTERRTDACAHAECMTTFIPTDNQVYGGLPAHTHAQMHTYVRYVHNTYIPFVCLI